MINKSVSPTPGTATLTYVAESERDAERLRGQVDAPVRVRHHRTQVTIDATVLARIGVAAAETSQTPGAPGTPATSRQPRV